MTLIALIIGIAVGIALEKTSPSWYVEAKSYVGLK